MTNDWLIVFVDCWLMKIFLGGEGEWSDINKNGNDYVKTRSLKKKQDLNFQPCSGLVLANCTITILFFMQLGWTQNEKVFYMSSKQSRL